MPAVVMKGKCIIHDNLSLGVNLAATNTICQSGHLVCGDTDRQFLMFNYSIVCGHLNYA